MLEIFVEKWTLFNASTTLNNKVSRFSGANDADKLATMKLTLQNLVSRGGNPALEKMLLLVHPIMEAFAYVKPSSKTNASGVVIF